MRQSGFFGDVGECAVAIVLVEAIGGAGGDPSKRVPEAEDIEPAVVVVIDEGAAAADGFED